MPGTTGSFFIVYSTEGRKFERKSATADSWMPRIREGQRSLEDNRKALHAVVKDLSQSLNSRSRLIALIADRPVGQQASLLAYFVLDAHLTFVKSI